METCLCNPDQLPWLVLVSLCQGDSPNNLLTTHLLHLQNLIPAAHLLKVNLYAVSFTMYFSFIDNSPLDDSFRLEEEYDRIKLLGKGGFGVVYHVKHKTDRQEYAVKIIKL